jgi:hypothetical protein
MGALAACSGTELDELMLYQHHWSGLSPRWRRISDPPYARRGVLHIARACECGSESTDL